MKKYYVYALARPDDTIFYIGKGQGRRVHQHEHEVNKPDKIGDFQMLNTEKCSVLREILEANEQVKKIILFETDSEAEALIYEWGMMYATTFAEQLTNKFHYHPGPNACRYYPHNQGVYRVYPKDKKGRHKHVDVAYQAWRNTFIKFNKDTS